MIGSSARPDSVRPMSNTERQISIEKTASMWRPINDNGRKSGSHRFRDFRNVAVTEAVIAKFNNRKGPRCHLSNSHVRVSEIAPEGIGVQRQTRKAFSGGEKTQWLIRKPPKP